MIVKLKVITTGLNLRPLDLSHVSNLRLLLLSVEIKLDEIKKLSIFVIRKVL